MKKIILMVVAASISIATFAQRNCDLKTTMLTPPASSTITSGSNITLSFKLTNLGPDAIAMGDTIVGVFALDAGALGSNFLYIFPAALPKDSSLNLVGSTLKLTFNSSANGAHNVCVVVQMAMRPTVVVDPVNTNNSSCNAVTLAGGSTGIGSINNIIASDINAYPNPATDKMNFDFKVEKEGAFNFEIFDINGKLVKSDNHILTNGNQTITLDLNGLTKGFYSCKISSDNYSVVSKFMIE